jgi:sugar O-acyltransferase (sialic acid O-acetyltransferase NeuD family)
MKLVKGYIFGAGAQGRVALDILKEQYPKSDFYFVDENPEIIGKEINNTEVLSLNEILKYKTHMYLHIAIGNPILREKIFKKLKHHKLTFINAIHPSAIISKTAILGRGNMIGAGVVINTNAIINQFCILNTGVIIEHDSIIEDFACICPGAIIGGRVLVKSKAFISTGALISARVIVGETAIVGMGAVVLKNVEEKTITFGVHSRKLGIVDENYNWNKVL